MLKEIEKLSEEHNEQFPLMAVVIFNKSNAHVIDALKKQSYVDALDEITGEQISVFWAAANTPKVIIPGVRSGMMNLMTPVHREPSCNKSLFEYFNILDDQCLPLLVTFTFTSNDQLLFSKHKISEKSTEDAYNTLKVVLNEKARLIADFQGKLLTDKEKMFKELRLFDKANNSIGILSKFLNLVPSLRSGLSI